MPILLERILGQDWFDGEAAAKAIADEIRVLGGAPACKSWGSGWKVSAPRDWLPADDPLSVFDRPRPLRDLPHSAYAEVVLLPHCSFVATATPKTVNVLQAEPGRSFKERVRAARTIWFEPR